MTTPKVVAEGLAPHEETRATEDPPLIADIPSNLNDPGKEDSNCIDLKISDDHGASTHSTPAAYREHARDDVDSCEQSAPRDESYLATLADNLMAQEEPPTGTKSPDHTGDVPSPPKPKVLADSMSDPASLDSSVDALSVPPADNFADESVTPNLPSFSPTANATSGAKALADFERDSTPLDESHIKAVRATVTNYEKLEAEARVDPEAAVKSQRQSAEVDSPVPGSISAF